MKNYLNQAAHGISLFLVDSNLPGFHKGSKLKKLGLKGQVLQKKEFLEQLQIVKPEQRKLFIFPQLEFWSGHSRAIF